MKKLGDAEENREGSKRAAKQMAKRCRHRSTQMNTDKTGRVPPT
jgi:hypothetical protein